MNWSAEMHQHSDHRVKFERFQSPSSEAVGRSPGNRLTGGCHEKEKIAPPQQPDTPWDLKALIFTAKCVTTNLNFWKVPVPNIYSLFYKHNLHMEFAECVVSLGLTLI